MRRPRWCSAAALAACAMVSGAQDRPPTTPSPANRVFTIQPRYAVGDVLRYRVRSRVRVSARTQQGQSPFPTGEAETTLVVRHKTVAVRPDGTAVVAVTVSDVQVTAGGRRVAAPPVPTAITMEVDRRGRVVGARGMEGLPGGAALSRMMTLTQLPGTGVVLPSHPVLVGDSWDTQIAFIAGARGAAVTATLLGVESLGGQETLRVRQVWRVPVALTLDRDGNPTADAARADLRVSGAFTLNTIANIRPVNGRLVRLAGDGSGQMTFEARGALAKESAIGSRMVLTLKMTQTMDLLSVGTVTAPPTGAGAAPAGPVGRGER